jgi:hypothetical protein
MIMVNPVNSGSNYVSKVQPQPQPAAERIAEKEKAKPTAIPATNVPVQPTVNTNGQKVGAIINVKA